MEKTIRILIVDDHAIVRHGLRLMLELKSGIEVIGEAKDGNEAISLAIKLTPDVILMDLEMPQVNGLQAITAIYAESPDIRILVLTSFADSEKIASAIRNGAAGYLLKDTSPGELVQAIKEVDEGHVSLPPEIAQKLVEGLQKTAGIQAVNNPLTNRECEILQFAACGLSNQDIASKLVISEGTVRFHFSNIFSKLQVNNRSQALVYALRHGWVNLTDSS